MLNFLLGEDKNSLLLNQQSFSSNYELITKSCLVMGKANPPIHVSSTATVNLKQTVEKKEIYTKVSFVDMTTETDHNNFKESLREMQLFTKISPVIEIQRNDDGTRKKIINLPEMWNDWERWKKKQLPLIIPDEHKQQRIIKNYENGLKILPDVFGKNMQYMLLLPRCYKFKKYHNPMDLVYMAYSSRFVEKLDIHYRLSKKSFSYKNNIVKLSLNTQITDEYNPIEKQLVPFYEAYMPDFSFKDYFFDVKVEYTFDQNTSEVIDANLLFEERLHPDFKYIIKMDLINKTRQDSLTDIIQSTSAGNPSPPNINPNKKRWTILLDDDSLIID